AVVLAPVRHARIEDQAGNRRLWRVPFRTSQPPVVESDRDDPVGRYGEVRLQRVPRAGRVVHLDRPGPMLAAVERPTDEQVRRAETGLLVRGVQRVEAADLL